MSEKRKVLKVTYDSQNDNKPFTVPATIAGDGRIDPYDQCFYTSLKVLVGHFIKALEPEKAVEDLIEAIEPSVGKGAWIGRVVIRKIPGMANKRLGALGDTAPIAIDEIFKKYGVKKKAIFVPSRGTDAQIVAAIDSGSPFLLSTKITSAGHFIVIIGYILVAGKVVAWICHDPYGNGMLAYKGPKGKNGANVEYSRDWLFARTGDPSGRGWRGTYVT